MNPLFSALLLSCDFAFTLPRWQDAPPMLAVIFAAFLFCFVLERVVPGWKLPQVATWPLRVLLINGAQLLVVVVAGLSWEKWFSAYSLLHVSRQLGPVAGGLLAYAVATFVFYWWHRWRHTQDFLWRHFHQIHHSPRRLEVITSFYKHPLEMTVNSLLGGLLVYTVLGLSPAAGAMYTLCTALGEFFYHTNVRTPRWVGYIFQRPEMHRVHHQYQQHSHNYGDLVIWDYLFGTDRHPATFEATCGFDPDKEEKLTDMLLFKDVHAQEARKEQQAPARTGR